MSEGEGACHRTSHGSTLPERPHPDPTLLAQMRRTLKEYESSHALVGTQGVRPIKKWEVIMPVSTPSHPPHSLSHSTFRDIVCRYCVYA